MDLGCLDMGCIEKQRNQSSFDSNDSPMSSSKIGKNKTSRESHSSMNGLNKFASQIRKPPRRKGSPLNWFPRTKVDSYLKRKIKLLQEVDGMNSSLVETLGDSNPHYSKVLREKIAVREAAHKAMEARKAAMVEASWCRILRASRIDSKEAEALLLKAEKIANEAFEGATATGVIMYDTPGCTRKHYEIETSNPNEGDFTTHGVKASFGTTFEVDKQVAAAVKAAFIKLANCPSINRDEFKELLRKISQNPDTEYSNVELAELSSECESDTGSELESASLDDGMCCKDFGAEALVSNAKQRKYKKQLSEKFHMANLVDIMLERLRCLHEDELASLATIVATCGLNAALAESDNRNQHCLDASADSTLHVNLPRRVSSFGAGRMRRVSMAGQRQNQVETDLPSLDKFLVKRLTRLEKEVQEAKNSKTSQVKEGCGVQQEKADDKNVCDGNLSTGKTTDLGSILVKHRSKLEREMEEARKNSREMFGEDQMISNRDSYSSEVVPDYGMTTDLGSILVKHKSKLEKEIEEARKNSREMFGEDQTISNRDSNSSEVVPDYGMTTDLGSFLVKHKSKLEKEIEEARKNSAEVLGKDHKFSNSDSNSSEVVPDFGSMLTRKHVSKLHKVVEDAKRMHGKLYESNGKKPQKVHNGAFCRSTQDGTETPSLDKVLVKHVTELERVVQEAKNGKKTEPHEEGKETKSASPSLVQDTMENSSRSSEKDRVGKENIDLNKKENQEISQDRLVETKGTSFPNEQELPEGMKVLSLHDDNEGLENSLDRILVKPVHRLEREKMKALSEGSDDYRVRRYPRRDGGNNVTECESLDKVLVKHVSRLEKEKMEYATKDEMLNVKRKVTKTELENSEGSLDQILVKPKSRLERDKMTASVQQPENEIKHSSARREAREKELQEAWGGLSLGNSIRPHQSRLQRDKAAWLKAEEEERKRAMEHV